MVDPWSLVHFSTGLAAGLVRIPVRLILPTAIAYEVAEQVLERSEGGQELFETSGPESLANVIMDVALFAAGHWLGRVWSES